jgi:hypothetical protein
MNGVQAISPVIIHSESHFGTTAEKLRYARSTGRRPGSVAGSHIADMVSLGRSITLCSDGCKHKFDAERHGYHEARRFPFHGGVISNCDGCRAKMAPCAMFVREG